MGKKFKSKGFSVRGSGDFLDVRVFSNGVIVFKGGAALNQKDKVKGLFQLLKHKGVIEDDEDKWW